ncbi:helix-turn-helix domain-containing protein [Vibrio diazotrophicus]|uniref:helix-turn-helix domain-containing protein n=1 Tax=Vibrio diazotrophicus TaxID=685 RepID=UPI0005AB1F2B|nr:helix-turn-helix domain-containing protein [Vibrio diazotrophicus]
MKNNVTTLRKGQPHKQNAPRNFKAEQWAYYDKAKIFLTKGRQNNFLRALITFANRDNCCWKSIATFAREMGVSEKTVSRAIRELEELDLIVVFRNRKTSSRSHPNTYYLNFGCELFDTVNNIDACGQARKNYGDTSLDAVNLSSEIRSDCPQDTVNMTPEYKGIIHTNTKTGEEPDLMKMWSHLKGFVKWKNDRSLPSLPSEDDLNAMLWTIDNFSVNPKSQKDCLAIFEFVINELGESQAVLNPLVRLKKANKENSQGKNPFIGRFKEWRKNRF